jgi:hypothetical protein
VKKERERKFPDFQLKPRGARATFAVVDSRSMG